MTPERWQQVETLFHRALERQSAEREAFLREQCGNDSDLRREVDRLLTRASEADRFLEQQPFDETTLTVQYPEAGISHKIGPYQVVSRLGAGGMGVVYRAHDSKLRRDVAIKILPSEFAHDPERLTRFRREAYALASLNHPNIAAIYGLEESGDSECLVMELVEGEVLHGPLLPAEALKIAEQLADALAAAHDKGIVHRDLKPSNIKITPEGRVKVLDFGLAKALGQEKNPDLTQPSASKPGATMLGRILGTPGYMSPEQARGAVVDQRTDIWAFGCVLYELLAGKRAFQGKTIEDTIGAVLASEPEWRALPSKVPARIKDLLRRCLQKDPNRRPSDIREARSVIERVSGRRNWWRYAAAAMLLLTAGAAASIALLRQPAPISDPSQWAQLTKFPDSVSQPAFSSDGRMVAFIHGPSTFFGPGQIYVKILPDGDPVELTHDSTEKLHPQFSPDGTRIAYGTYLDQRFAWDTWEVPVLGGEPRQMFTNATGLTWTAPGRLLFSEIKMGVHMGVVTADENRGHQRDVYLPMSDPRMAHRSYLSPDGKWVLLVEMDDDHLWEPCRVVPFDGSTPGYKVGPPNGGCTTGAWSPDGRWMYMTSNGVGENHIWRQRFPNGKPEQITFGPTEEEGVAIAPDGRSFITAVALANSELWLHDAAGERQVPIEGNPATPMFTPDGRKVVYRLAKEPPSEFSWFHDSGEVRIADLSSGRSEPVVRGVEAFSFDLSFDGKQVVLQTSSPSGQPQLWLAPLDHSAPPHQIPNVAGGFPRFLPDGEILFRQTAESTAVGTTGFMYRTKEDGSGMQKALEAPVLIPYGISPDGKWLQAWAPVQKSGFPAMQLFPLAGGTPIPIATATGFQWSRDGRYVSIMSLGGSLMPEGRGYIVPLPPGQMYPSIPAGGFSSEEQVARLPGAKRIDLAGADSSVPGGLVPGPSADTYLFYRNRVQRNLYRIPIR